MKPKLLDFYLQPHNMLVAEESRSKYIRKVTNSLEPSGHSTGTSNAWDVVGEPDVHGGEV